MNINIKMLHPETEEVLIEGISARLTLTFDELIYKPVFCLTGINASALKQEFGNYALVISPKQFIDTVTKKLNELGYLYLTFRTLTG
ncbi:hypothetical protein B1A75_18285 [Geobacillus sp. LEMMY01]|nr:hypothetical protein B1A75_18285 [Geobacillus sp. LEMMY01]